MQWCSKDNTSEDPDPVCLLCEFYKKIDQIKGIPQTIGLNFRGVHLQTMSINTDCPVVA